MSASSQDKPLNVVTAVYADGKTHTCRGISGIAPVDAPVPGWVLAHPSGGQVFVSAAGVEILKIEPQSQQPSAINSGETK